MRLLPLFCIAALPTLASEFEAGRSITAYHATVDKIVPADLDGDGDMDLVTRDEFLGAVTVYENSGRGHFKRTAGWEMTGDEGLSEMADMDADGCPDLVLTTSVRNQEEDSYHTTARILFGAGLAGFGPREQDLGDFEWLSGFGVADVDSSGFPDLLHIGGTLLDPGKGGPLHPVDPLPIGVHFTQMSEKGQRWLDWTGDGLLDLCDSRGYVWWENLGGGLLSDIQEFPYPEGPGSLFVAQAIRDSSLNGGRGLIMTRGEEGSVRPNRIILFAPDENDQWNELASTPIVKAGEGCWFLGLYPQPDGRIFASVERVPDVENVQIRTFRHEVVEISLRFRRGVPSVVVTPLFRNLPCQATALALADMNRDGHDDLVVGLGYERGTQAQDFGGSRISYYRGEAGGGFSGKPVDLTPASSQESVRAVVDFDSDGDDDLICEGYSPSRPQAQISVWINQRQGTRFTRRALLSGADWIRLLGTEDRNKDGRPDIMAVSHEYLPSNYQQDARVQLSLSSRLGARKVKTVMGHRSDENHVQTGDWDGDGTSDLLLWSFYSPASQGGPYRLPVTWLKGLASNRFAAPESLGEGYVEALYDADGDGDLDLVPTESTFLFGAPYSWRENTGSGNPPLGRDFPLIGGDKVAPTPAFADLDGDGRMDFRSFNLPLLAKADGSFEALPLLPQGQSWFRDVDGDSDPDVVIRSQKGSITGIAELLWMENLGSAQFSEARLLHDSTQSYWDEPLAGDLDGDGKMDLIVSAAWPRPRIMWFKGK